MMHVRLPILALVAFLLPGLTGCDDSTSPGDGDLADLDARDLVIALNDLSAPLAASSPANTNLSNAVADLTEAGVVFRTIESVIRERARHGVGFGSLPLNSPLTLNGSLPPLPPLAVTFPPELMGQTFVFDFEAQQWQTDDTRTDAPADGVRLTWYTLDGSGGMQFPLEERGHIDLTPGSGEGDAMDVRVVETAGSGSLVLLDFLQNRDSTGEEVQVKWFTASGHFADESASSNFVVGSEQTEDGATDDTAFELDVDLENEETLYSMHVAGTQGGDSGAFEDRFTATVVRGGASTVLNVSFEGTGTTQEEASGTLLRNGTLIANINIVGGSFDFSAPDGGTFSGSQATDLNALFSAMTRTGFEVLLNLPLILP